MRRRIVIAGLLLVSGATLVVSILVYQAFLQGSGPVRPYPHLEVDAALAGPLVFISDTQAPLWFETLRLEEDGNVAATSRLFSTIARLRPVQAVFHLGDITAVGSSGREWRVMDGEIDKLRVRRIPFFPIMGNHDYLLWARRGVENFLARFDYARPSWYLVRAGQVAVIALNSNFDRLRRDQRGAQRDWYTTVLDRLERDSAVRWILVACHHAPYTNSTIVTPSREVQQEFVSPFIAARKGALFLSGHAHAYEHFVISGKDFVVCGGGGGLLHPLLATNRARWPDRIDTAGRQRYFHYLECRPGPDGLEVSIHEIERDAVGSRRVYGLVVGP